MHISDYFRLSATIISAHKKQAFMIIFIISLPLVLLSVCLFTLHGTQSAIMSAMLAPTNGEIILSISVDSDYCQENCRLQDNLADIRQNLSENHGQILDAYFVTTELGTFIQLPDLPVPAQNLPGDTITIAAPIETAARLANIELPRPSSALNSKLDAIETTRQATFQKTITSQDNTYFLNTFLPTDIFVHNFSLSGANRDQNPLNLVLANFRTAPSANLIYGDIPHEIPRINSAEAGILFAKFADIQSASDYFYSSANHCTESDRMLKVCGDSYRYRVSSVVGSPIDVYHSFQEIWSIFNFIAIAISTVTAIVIVSTYMRLINKDMRTIALYYAMGARRPQVITIYVIYLLILSALAALFTVTIGLIISLVISCLSINPLSQVFTLAFTVTSQPCLTAYNWGIAALCGFVLLLAPISILLSTSFLTNKKLAKNLTI